MRRRSTLDYDCSLICNNFYFRVFQQLWLRCVSDNETFAMTLVLTPDSDVVKLLREEASKPSVSCIAFRRIIFDEDVAAAVLQLYRSDVARKWKQIEFYQCTGLIEVALTAPLVLDAVESFTIPYLDVPTS